MSPRPEPAQPTSPAPPRQLSGWRAGYARFCSKPAVLALAAAILVAIRVVDCSGEPAAPAPVPVSLLTTAGIESQIRVGLAVQLGTRDTTVESVTCRRDSDARATCEAEMSGDGAGRYEIDARLGTDGELLSWQVVGRLPSRR